MTGESIAPGTTIDRYLIEGTLGQGGFGVVYRARHTVIDRPVALKVLKEERDQTPELVERFLLEAKAAARIGSPHIVHIMDAGRSPSGQAFLAMELLEGEDLLQRLHEAGTLPMPVALGIAVQILAGLAAAHASGIVHRDMKPANVFLAKAADGSDLVKLLDFGISKVLESGSISSLTKTGMMLGTPHYMAPEQIRSSKDVDGRADLYSVGVILFQMLSGTLPYDADSYEQLILKVHHEAPQSLAAVAPSLPQALTRIVERALARDPDARWQSAGELSQALQSAWRSSGAMLAAPSTAPLAGYARSDESVPVEPANPIDPTRPLGAQGPLSTPHTRFSPQPAAPHSAAAAPVAANGTPHQYLGHGTVERRRASLHWLIFAIGGLFAAVVSAAAVIFALEFWDAEPEVAGIGEPIAREPLRPVQLETGSHLVEIAREIDEGPITDPGSAGADDPTDPETGSHTKHRNKRGQRTPLREATTDGPRTDLGGAGSLIGTAREPTPRPSPTAPPAPTLGDVRFRIDPFFHPSPRKSAAVLAMLRQALPAIRRCLPTNEEVIVQLQTTTEGAILGTRALVNTPAGVCVAGIARNMGRIENREAGLVRFSAQRATR